MNEERANLIKDKILDNLKANPLLSSFEEIETEIEITVNPKLPIPEKKLI